MKMNVTDTVKQACGHWPRILPALGVKVMKKRHQHGSGLAVGVGFRLSGGNNVLSNRRQVAVQGVHLSGGLGGRHAEHLFDQFQSVTRAALVAEPRPAPARCAEALTAFALMIKRGAGRGSATSAARVTD